MNTNLQRDPQLGLFESTPADANVQWLEKLLHAHGKWMTATELLRWVGRPETDDQKRLIRQLASASEWIISGQRGYCRIEHATAEEIQHACGWLESQARQMAERAGRLRRNGHRILH